MRNKNIRLPTSSTINLDISNATDDSNNNNNNNNPINTTTAVASSAAAAVNDKIYELNKFGLSYQDKILESFSCALYPNKGSILSQGR